MQKRELSSEEYKSLMEGIADIIRSNGLKATTMDLVAATLGMSKRTLYEIFENKQEMISEVLRHVHEGHVNMIHKVFESSDNVLEAWVRILRLHMEELAKTNVVLFRDLDKHFEEIHDNYHDHKDNRREEVVKLCRLGVKQGVFRGDVNYDILTRMFDIQMESLKRMEEVFPPDISFVEAFKTISICFLRSIVTPCGMEMLDAITGNGNFIEINTETK